MLFLPYIGGSQSTDRTDSQVSKWILHLKESLGPFARWWLGRTKFKLLILRCTVIIHAEADNPSYLRSTNKGNQSIDYDSSIPCIAHYENKECLVDADADVDFHLEDDERCKILLARSEAVNLPSGIKIFKGQEGSSLFLWFWAVVEEPETQLDKREISTVLRWEPIYLSL